MRALLIIPAGGTGKRFGSPIPKQFDILADKPLIIHTLSAFSGIEEIIKVVIPVHEDWHGYLANILKSNPTGLNISIINGGTERQDSVYKALSHTESENYDIILVHDAVRPFVTKGLIEKLISAALMTGTAVPFTRPKDTLRLEKHGSEYELIDREKICSIQTPQVFDSILLHKAYQTAYKSGIYSTDDAALVELTGSKITMIEGEESNIKITTPFDKQLALTLAQTIIKK